MKGKVVICRCEDVTLKDVENSIAHGYADIEEVKRYTGFGTGPCQGKECHAVMALLIAERTGQPPESIAPFTSRPPVTPVPLKLFVRDETACYPLQGAAPDDDEGAAK